MAKFTLQKIERELWEARRRFEKDNDFIKFIAGWLWSHMADEYKAKKAGTK